MPSKEYTSEEVLAMICSRKTMPALTDDVEIVDSHKYSWDYEEDIYDRWNLEYLRRQNIRLRREKILLRGALNEMLAGEFMAEYRAIRVLKLTEDKDG